MKKVWNVKTKQYDWVAEGIWIAGTDYDLKGATDKWNSRFPQSVRKPVLGHLLNSYVDELKSFEKMHQFFEAVEAHVVNVNHEYVNEFRGKHSPNKNFDAIPDNFKPAIIAIAKEVAQNYDRGPHNTCPSVSASQHPYREYQLLPLGTETAGRATTALYRGQLFIYYSEGHAFATYNYHLVTFKYGPDHIEMPLTGRARDALIKRPFDPA